MPESVPAYITSLIRHFADLRDETRAGAGCKPHRLPRGEGREFSLDILFHRMSAIAIFRQLPNSCHSEQIENPANGTIEPFATLLR